MKLSDAELLELMAAAAPATTAPRDQLGRFSGRFAMPPS